MAMNMSVLAQALPDYKASTFNMTTFDPGISPKSLRGLDEAQAQLWLKTVNAMGIAPQQTMLDAFELYYQLLEAGNAQMNLTRLTSPEEFWFKHMLDALLLYPKLPKAGLALDLGSGGGVPLFPLAQVSAPLHWHSIESTQKKATFLQTSAAALGVPVQVFAMRAEDAGRDAGMREQYDVVTARAVASLPVLLELATPLLKPGGCALFLKGPGVQQELEQAQTALAELNCKVKHRETHTIPVLDSKSVVLCIQKLANTPKIYPRKPGIPAKKPL
ncbi:MAG: 16S rRNA (guanine(527)-N(7))-methyltransferase RsmG [Vampirovibrionales bacterium]|nr:16S rRNA (guanine(527)-N(7))-methyltransferase RsmG [Vampirovibrionales bacterium]